VRRWPNEEFWHEMLSEGNAVFDKVRAALSLIPSDSRCMFCHGPFDDLGGRVMSIMGKGQAREDPRVCNSCVKQGQKHPGGAHVDVATVFADMRGSTPTAERIGDRAFSELIDRFSKASGKVLIDAGAIVGRLAGDQAIGYFVPGFAGRNYAQAALDAAIELLRVTGHTDEEGPWIPLGVGVHAGNAYVGVVGSAGSTERTAPRR
jgi:adenylate cyclase